MQQSSAVNVAFGSPTEVCRNRWHVYLELKSGLVTDIAPRQRRARNGQLPTSRRRAANIRIGDFAAALNKTLRQRSERAILDPDESDRRRRRQNFDWQNLDVHLLTAKTHDRGGDETKPTPRLDKAQLKMERYRQYLG